MLCSTAYIEIVQSENNNVGILTWIVVGLIAGAIAKAIYPGFQGGGFIATTLLGIVGALIGGFLGSALLGVGFTGLTIQGILVAVLGACVALFVYGLVARNAV